MQKRSIVLLLGIVVLLALSGEFTRDRADHGGLQLEPPSFVALVAEAQAQEKGVNFLQQEAGISAYVKVEQAIDITKAKGAFKTTETASDEYVIGEIALPGLPDEAHPHVYVNKDGWIVAYYSNNEPASKIMQWIGYGGGPINRTTLEDAIRKVYDAIQLPYPQAVKYYDFKYPSASRIMLAAKINNLDDATVAFYVTIPQGVDLYEASWSVYNSGRDFGRLAIDDEWITANVNGFQYGDFTSRIKVQYRHAIKIYNDQTYTRGSSSVALALIYSAKR
jgi:hypothetical protein